MNGDGRSFSFPTDYASILARIDQIHPLEYGRTRNFIDGAVTYLSPYISRGVISVKHVRDITLSKGFAPHAIVKFLQELAWREYFQRVWQEKGDALFQDLKHPQQDVSHYKMIEAIVSASTGILAIDQAIRNFYATGYLHNHVRMYIACLACNLGKAHWLVPSRWMYAHLLDGDLASNTCSWQWVAGAFSNKKYYCNQENINRFMHSNQHDSYLDASVESLQQNPVPNALASTAHWNLETVLPVTSIPTLDVSKPTLIYNGYNLDPVWRKNEVVNRVLLLEPSHFKRFPVSKNVVDFIIALSKNIPGLQLMVGEVSDLQALYQNQFSESKFISKEHPAFVHYPGIKDERDWMFPEITGYYPSFFKFWKKCCIST